MKIGEFRSSLDSLDSLSHSCDVVAGVLNGPSRPAEGTSHAIGRRLEVRGRRVEGIMVQRIRDRLPSPIRSGNPDTGKTEDFSWWNGESSKVPVWLTEILRCLEPLFLVDLVGCGYFLGLLLESLLSMQGSV